MPPVVKTQYPHEPDYAVPPGETLEETLAALGMDQRSLAVRAGLSEKHVSQIINGHARVTHETAIKLERVTGVPATMWNNLEMSYRERLARIDDKRKLEADLGWLKTIPTGELIRRGVFARQPDRSSLLNATLAFFGVSSTQAWQNVWMKPDMSFRKSTCFKTRPGPTATWLRLGELEARGIKTASYSKDAFKDALDEIRKLTVEPPEVFQARMVELCAGAGVALVFVPGMKGCTASGVTRWLTPGKAMIQMSLRYKTDDHFWFTFFHEAGHVLNDGKKEVFIEDGDHDDDREERADRFAASLLIPRAYAPELPTLTTKRDVRAFANKIGIAPGIVVGRLQYDDLIKPSFFNDLKQRFSWRDA